MKAPALSLFAGAGGFDIGVDKAGFKTVCSVEMDTHCVSTLRRNGRGKAVWQVDVRALDPLRMADSLGFGVGELALLHGGPPCQPFSQIGKRKGVADSQGELAFEMAGSPPRCAPPPFSSNKSPDSSKRKPPKARACRTF